MNEDNILKEQGTPLTGTPRYTPGASGFGLKDPEGNAVGSTWYSIETPTPSVADQGARIGDYVLQKGKATVIPNSPTDLSQRYKIAIGGTSAPADTVSIANEGTGAVAGATIGAASLAIGGPIGMAVGGLVGGLAGALNSHNIAAEEALKNWQEENIKYDSAVTFYRDDNGTLKYDIDYQKMGTGGARSGEAVKEAQNRETKVELGDDGRLKINVSPIFASTARFNELVNWISENYAGLNKDTENLDTILNEIQNGIDGEAQSFVTNMRLYADYANRFPEASPEAIVSAYMTEAAGYVNPEDMSNFQMTVVGESGLETKNAAEFFDSVLKMDKDGRNALLERLNEIVFGDNDYSENDKAVAFGEIKALYAVSNNPEQYENSKYQGMLDADPFVTFWYSFAPLGLNTGDVLKFVSGGNLMKSKQEFLNQNDFANFIGSAGGIAAGFGLWKAGTSLIEKGIKLLPGTSQLFNASLEGQEGGAIAFFAQNTGNTKTVLKAASASAAFKTLKVGIFDAALSGSKVLVSNEDFWTEFGRDFTRDALLEAVFSYYDLLQFTKGVNDSTVLVVRDPKTGDISKLPVTEAQEAFDDGLEVAGAYNVQKTRAGEEAGIVQSEYGTTYYYNGTAVTVSRSGETQKLLTSPEAAADGVPAFKTGVTEPVDSVKTQEIELGKALEQAGFSKDAEIFEMPATDAAAAQVAGKIAKFDTSKAGLAINKYLFNKNAALDTVNELALAKTGDRTAWQNRSEKFVDISRNAEQEISLMKIGYYVKSSEQAFADYDNVLGKFNLTFKYTKRDANYLKALRGLEMAAYLDRTKAKDDPRNYTAEALEKYGEAIAKIPSDRAAVLKDFQDIRKARHDATKASAKKSKKIDIKKLENVMDSDIQKEIGWVPQWGKKTTYRGLLDEYNAISTERDIYKEWLPDGGWVDLDKLEDPLEADRRFLEFVTTNMGTTDMMTATADALSDAGLLVDNTPTSETIRKKKLESIKNKDELKDKLTEMIDAKKKEVGEKVMSQKQYKNWALGLYEKYGIDEAIEGAIGRQTITPKNWDQVWKNAGPEVRKTIRSELEKTSLQTGYGIKDTRARLNAQIPGADVLDWSLLGRDHTNGLVPGGLYAGKDNPVKVYIMSIDDLAKLTGYDLDKNVYATGSLIEKNINTKGGVPVLPAHIRSGGDGPEIWLKMRWGHNNDLPEIWAGYLQRLKERGIEKVPVAFSDSRFDTREPTVWRIAKTDIPQKNLDSIVKKIDKSVAKFTKLELTPREVSAASYVPGYDPFKIYNKIRRSVPQELFSEEDWSDVSTKALEYNWDEDAELNRSILPKDTTEDVILNKLGHAPQDITADVQRAFSEYGQIPFFRGQRGLGEFNMNDLSPTGQVGDAYWIAPNASYTDEYGKDKIMGTIPVKYFMSDKEKNELVGKLREELLTLDRNILPTVEKKYSELKKWLMFEIDKGQTPQAEKTREDYGNGIIASVEKEPVMAYGILRSDSYTDAQKKKAAEFLASQKYIDDKPIFESELERLPKNKLWKDVKKAAELKKIVDSVPYEPMSGNFRDKIVSYRALAEYAGKPIIDISEDGFAAGTAFFYYKGVDPEFDKEIGQQLAAQELFDRQNPRWTGDTIANSMEEYDGMSLDEMIDSVTMGQGFGEGWDNLFEQFNAGEISSSELSEEVSKFFKGVEKRYPGIGKVMQETWDNNTIQDLRDMKFKYWHPSTGYPTIDDNVAGQFLEDMGERPPQAGEPIPEGQTSAWDVVNPTSFANVPTEPQFRQPSRVTYNDYLAGVEANPSSRGVIRSALKGAAADKLIKQASSLLYEAAEYNKNTGYTFDVRSYLNTSTIPNVSAAIKAKDRSLAAAAINEAILDVAPYQSRSEVMKGQQDVVAEEWREWAEKHIKAGRASSKELKKFIDDNDLKLPDDKRPLPEKVKHALWEMAQSGKKLPKIEGLNIQALKTSRESEEVEFAKERFNKALKAEENFNKLNTLYLKTGDEKYRTMAGDELEKRNEYLADAGASPLHRPEGWTSEEYWTAQHESYLSRLRAKDSDAGSRITKESFYKALDETPLFQSATKDKKELVDLVAAEINGETTDAYKMGAASTAAGLGNSYPFTWIRNGKPYTRFIITDTEWKRRLAENITEIFSDKQIIKQPGIVSRTASTIANDFRLLTTSFDPTRGPLNFSRDTIRGQITSGGQSLIEPTKVFKSWIENGNYTAAEKERLSKALDNAASMVAGETYNAAYRTPRKAKVQATKNYLSDTGAHPLRIFTYNLFHDPRSILEFPTNFFEGAVRRRLARSAAVIRLRQLQEDGASFKEQLEGMVDAATFAGREYTANFQRKGKLIGATSKYIAYQSTTYAGFEGIKRAFINNPEGVSKNFAVFLILYTILLADTLGDEDSRRNYYRLSDYDRGNSLVISLDDNTVLTIPLDQEVASLLFPYRRVIETLNGVDPVSFFEFIWGTLTEPMPFDLSGFSEGEGFNLTRGLEKLTAQNLPNLLAGIQEASTGYDLYYGSDLSVTDDTLKDYGIYNPEAGDYTTASNDSLVLRQIANATGIPQWQLQAMVSNYGGNVGSYVLNIIDKLSGATEEQQGGKDFANAVFKSFVATDQDAAARDFYNGIKQLQQEKRKVVQQIANYNEDIKTATGDAKVELQNKLQKVKDDFAVKVGDFVDKYISAYEITGGLSKSQAMQVYYLFRFDDDDTVYEQGSTEEYYNNKALQQFKNRATAMSAPILDRYYNNRLGNIYQDADGNWQHYLSSGMQAMRNSIYGQGEEHMVGLLNILEGKDSNLKALRTRIKNARDEAYDAKDWTTRDALGYELDKAVVDAISPYIERYGAENVLGNSEVLDYLSDWFIVPDDFIKPKRGRYVSLANSGSTQEAFVRPYIKYVFGLPTNYYSYSDTKLTSPSLGDFGR